MSKQLVLALAAGTTAFAGVVGSAATLGGVTSDDLGADTALVASCDTDGVDIAYTTEIDATSGDYEVTDVEVSGIDDGCAGQAISVSLLNDAGNSELGSATGVVGAPAEEGDPVTVALTVGDDVVAESVTQASVVISG